MARDGAYSRDIVRRFVSRQVDAGADLSLGCLHIPKTGGTSLVSLFGRMRAAGLRSPVYLPHRVGLSEAAAMYPEMRLVVVIRDPLERMASGFNSRLRCGRPRYDIPWTAREAEIFAELRSPVQFLRALIAEDRASRAAARRAMQAIIHLRRGYVAYFGDAGRVSAAAARFALVGEIGAMERIVAGIAARLGEDEAEVSALYRADHVAPVGGATALAGLTEGEDAALRRALAAEYSVYEALRALPAALRYLSHWRSS